ncbi:MAG: MFS transporter [Rhodoblastus sp.]
MSDANDMRDTVLPKRILLPLAFVNFTIGAGAFLVIALLAPLSQALSMSKAQAGWVMGAYALAYAVFSPVFIALTGAWRRRAVILAGLGLFIAASLASAFATSPGRALRRPHCRGGGRGHGHAGGGGHCGRDIEARDARRGALLRLRRHDDGAGAGRAGRGLRRLYVRRSRSLHHRRRIGRAGLRLDRARRAGRRAVPAAIAAHPRPHAPVAAPSRRRAC